MSCNNKTSVDSQTIERTKTEIKDYNFLADEHDYDSLLTKFDCPDEEDSLLDKRIKVLNDSIIDLYEQLILRLEIQSAKEKFKQNAEPFIESLNQSKKTFIEAIDADAGLIFYSYGTATGKGTEARCFKINILQTHLLFMKSVFENSCWNYDFDTLK